VRKSENPRVLPVLSEEVHWKKTMLVPQSTGSIHGKEQELVTWH